MESFFEIAEIDMKVHTTNYRDTLIEVADDCQLIEGKIPPSKGDKKTIAQLQFEMLFSNPYQYTSDDILFAVFATRNEIADDEREESRKLFFSKGQPCMRTSPLTKKYGWGIHCNRDAKIAMYGMNTQEYEKLLVDEKIKKVKAMRSKRI